MKLKWSAMVGSRGSLRMVNGAQLPEDVMTKFLYM